MTLRKKVVYAAFVFALVFALLNVLSLSVSPKRSASHDSPLMNLYQDGTFAFDTDVKSISEDNDPDRAFRYVLDQQRWYRLDPEPVIPDNDQLVLSFGDSSTFGWGLVGRDQAYPGELDQMLPVGTRSVNLGVPGYSSLQGLRYVEQMLLAHHGRIKAITLYFGNNDSTENGAPDAEKIQFEAQFVHSVLSRLPLYRAMSKLIPTRLNENRKPRVSPDEYEQNLRAMIELARSYEIRTIAIMPPEHLSWPPGHVRHGVDLTPRIQNTWTSSEMIEAKRLYDEGKALAYQQSDECEQRFRGAIEHDWVIPRIKVAWQARLRGLTAELQVPLIETQEVFIPAEYPGEFVDYCHPSERVHQQIAEQIAGRL